MDRCYGGCFDCGSRRRWRKNFGYGLVMVYWNKAGIGFKSKPKKKTKLGQNLCSQTCVVWEGEEDGMEMGDPSFRVRRWGRRGEAGGGRWWAAVEFQI